MVEVQPISTEDETPKREIGEGGVLTDEDIAALTSEGDKVQKDFVEYKKEKTQSIVDIRERITRHKNRLFTLEVDIGEEEPLILKVRRMTERERAQFNKDNFTRISNFDNMSAEEMDKLTMRGYKLMAKLIVDPDWTLDEWLEVADTSLLQHISGKVSMMTSESNDAVIIEEFKKKSPILPNSN